VGVVVTSTEERVAEQRREQLATWRYARDNNTVLWKSAENWIVSALDAEDAAAGGVNKVSVSPASV
jgi:hypothetical protein